MVTLTGAGFKGTGSFSGQGFKVAFQRPDPGPRDMLELDAIAIRSASVESVVLTTREVKEAIRDFVDAAFTNSEWHGNGRRRAANASAQEMFYDDIEARGQYAGLVYSKFGKRDKGGFIDYLLIHMRGATIRPRDGEWLRIRNKRAGQSHTLVAQTGHYHFSGSDIFFAKSKDGKKLFQMRRYRKGSLSARKGSVELLATLVKSVKIPARLSGVEAIARRRPELFEGHFAEALKARGVI